MSSTKRSLDGYSQNKISRQKLSEDALQLGAANDGADTPTVAETPIVADTDTGAATSTAADTPSVDMDTATGALKKMKDLDDGLAQPSLYELNDPIISTNSSRLLHVYVDDQGNNTTYKPEINF